MMVVVIPSRLQANFQINFDKQTGLYGMYIFISNLHQFYNSLYGAHFPFTMIFNNTYNLSCHKTLNKKE